MLLAVGFLTATLLSGSIVYAATGATSIEVMYNNIKVYKDNALYELKDGNGNVVEPFIYNGTTYMPVRGTANLAGMEVTWDSQTQSVYLWDKISPQGTPKETPQETSQSTYLLDVCKPYEVRGFDIYNGEGVNSFSMAGKNYTNGISTSYPLSPAILFNLENKYTALECVIGHTLQIIYQNPYRSLLMEM